MTKAQKIDEFKDEVYKNVGMLENLDDRVTEDAIKSTNGGCSGFLFNNLFVRFAAYGNKKLREKMQIADLNAKADELLAQKEIKDLLCANLDAKVKLPIDAAYKITPVLYDLAVKDEEKIPLNATLFAIICRKITEKGTQKYCR